MVSIRKVRGPGDFDGPPEKLVLPHTLAVWKACTLCAMSSHDVIDRTIVSCHACRCRLEIDRMRFSFAKLRLAISKKPTGEGNPEEGNPSQRPWRDRWPEALPGSVYRQNALKVEAAPLMLNALFTRNDADKSHQDLIDIIMKDVTSKET